jgi:hypothetical protein
MAVNVDGTLVAADQVRTFDDARRRAQQLRADLVAREVHPDVLTFGVKNCWPIIISMQCSKRQRALLTNCAPEPA